MTNSAGYRRLIASGKAEELRTTVVADQKRALSEAGKRRATSATATRARDGAVGNESDLPVLMSILENMFQTKRRKR